MPASLRFVTVTLNPAIDLAMSVERVVHTRKMRCRDVTRTPGGGGINVARVLSRLGAPATARFVAGGAEGERLCRILEGEGVACAPVTIAGETRESFNVLEEASGHEYRFVLPGPALDPGEVQALIDAVVADAPGSVVVMSGSLPPGAPASVYGDLAAALKGKAARIVLDASGEALAKGLVGVNLIKPSHEELDTLVGQRLNSRKAQLAACRALIDSGKTRAVALSLGAGGAMFVSADAAHHATALPLKTRSAVGAGDAFLAGLVWAQVAGSSPAESLAIAVATASAGLIEPARHDGAEAVRALARNVTVTALA
jgi:6-phosphofructokinase 2